MSNETNQPDTDQSESKESLRVVITGISGTLGQALGSEYVRRGAHVIGVSRREDVEGKGTTYSELFTLPQESVDDARALLDLEPDILILNAGQIETEVGEQGAPLTEAVESMNRVNYSWPAIVATEATHRTWKKPIELVAIGSIADGAPSPFGPVYHAGKIALNYYWLGVGPIAHHSSNGMIRMRLYRPGAIKGPLAWAPVNRLNERGYKIRKKRVEGAPEAVRVAKDIIQFIRKGKSWVATWDEPFTFRFFKFLHSFAPNLSYKAQMIGWRKGSKWGDDAASDE